MIMSVGLNCGFEFEKGRHLLICMNNKASSVAALCGHNPNWSAFAIGGHNRAAIPSGVAIDADTIPKIANVLANDSRRGFCVFRAPYGNDKMI
jgi:hypothetical protein